VNGDSEENNHDRHVNPIDWIFDQRKIDDFHRNLAAFLLLPDFHDDADDRKGKDDHKNHRYRVGWRESKRYTVFCHADSLPEL
jgi:hypothetical protein